MGLMRRLLHRHMREAYTPAIFSNSFGASLVPHTRLLRRGVALIGAQHLRIECVLWALRRSPRCVRLLLSACANVALENSRDACNCWRCNSWRTIVSSDGGFRTRPRASNWLHAGSLIARRVTTAIFIAPPLYYLRCT